jgi:hypothetical protein
MANNNGWTSENEKRIKKINKICKKISNESKKYALKYKNIYSFLMISTMILTPMAGTFSTLSSIFSLSNTAYNHIFAISSASLSFISSIGLSILKFAKYNKLSTDYTKIYTYYFSLNNNIKRQLSLEKKERQEYYEYNKWLLFHLDNLQNEMSKEFQEFPELMQLNIDLGFKLNNNMYKLNICKEDKNKDENTSDSSNASIENEKNMFIINLEEENNTEDENKDENILNYTEDRFHDGMMMYEIKRLRN